MHSDLLSHPERRSILKAYSAISTPFKLISIDDILDSRTATTYRGSLSKALYCRHSIIQISTQHYHLKPTTVAPGATLGQLRLLRLLTPASNSSSGQPMKRPTPLRCIRSRTNTVLEPHHSPLATTATLIHLPHLNARFTEINRPWQNAAGETLESSNHPSQL